MQVKSYNQIGEEAGLIDLPDAVFAVPWNADLVHQVVVGMEANAREPWAHTKGRGEVRGGGKKPWKQKGTGRARHGSIRSPLWRGGGVTFGPRNEKNYSKKINKKMRAKALFATLSEKLRDGEILFLDRLAFPAPKTADAKRTLAALARIEGFEPLATKRRNAALLALATRDETVEKSFRNFGNIGMIEARNLNPVEVLKYKYLIVTEPRETVAQLAGKIVRGTNVKIKTSAVAEAMADKQKSK
jgi:large subunit ribosomal protein L4